MGAKNLTPTGIRSPQVRHVFHLETFRRTQNQADSSRTEFYPRRAKNFYSTANNYAPKVWLFTVLIFMKLANRSTALETQNTKFHPNRSVSMQRTARNSVIPLSKLLLMQSRFSRNSTLPRRLVKNSYSAFHENPSNALAADTRLQDGRTSSPRKAGFILGVLAKSRKAPIRFVPSVLPHLHEISHWRHELNSVENKIPSLFTIGRKIRELYMKTQVGFILWTPTYIARQYNRKLAVAFPWQHLQYSCCSS
jgi:hypothetical protein